MRKAAANITILLVLCAGVLIPGAAEGTAIARGDFEFFLDSATFRLKAGGLQQDLYIRIPNSGLVFRKREPEFISRTKLTIQITGARGSPPLGAIWIMAMVPFTCFTRAL